MFPLSTAVANTTTTIKISFQTKKSRTPDGFLADNGDVYGDRGNGLTYGWTPCNIGNARDYSLIESDTKLATLNHFGREHIWEIAVPNGKYEVTVSIGNIKYPDEIKGKLVLMAENVVVFENTEVNGIWSHVKPIGQTYVSNTVEVVVNDGRLTLDPKDSANKNIHMNYIEIKPLSVPSPISLNSLVMLNKDKFPALPKASEKLSNTEEPVACSLKLLPEPSMDLYGWASVNAEGMDGTTGGGEDVPQTVTSLEELELLAGDDIPRVIVISGTISSGVNPICIGSNKTILGENKYATIHGGIMIQNSSNVIIRNLNFEGCWPIFGPDDTIAAKGSHHLWFDHLNIWDASDGLMDLTLGSNYMTVSWCKFFYSDPDNPHRLACLDGAGADNVETDPGKNKVTFHHNWFANHVDQRMPRILFGQAHIYNNYYTSSDNTYCIGAGVYASVLLENNYFKNVNNPHQFMYPDRRPANITAKGNIYDNTRGTKDAGANTPNGYDRVDPFTHPPYDYHLDETRDIPYLITRYAGPL